MEILIKLQIVEDRRRGNNRVKRIERENEYVDGRIMDPRIIELNFEMIRDKTIRFVKIRGAGSEIINFEINVDNVVVNGGISGSRMSEMGEENGMSEGEGV